MTRATRRIPSALVLGAGVLLGWGLSAQRAPTAKAVGGDRYGDWATTTGAISVQYNDATKTQTTQEAVYFLDYKGGRLLATIPGLNATAAGTRLINGVAERDLVTDFRLDPAGPMPHFLMTTSALNSYSDGWAPLFVFETTTRQVAVYRLSAVTSGTSNQPKFELIETRPLAANAARPGEPAAR